MLTYANKKFYLDGKEFRIFSGSLHYFRALPEYWEPLMRKFRAAGLNCVESYCPWNAHEPQPGTYDFSGMLDLNRFIQTAERVGLKVILRPGPFICAEWDNGGLPAWLLKDPSMRLRVNHEPYMDRVRSYFHKLFSVIRPHLHDNGGPIIAMAIENEYGSFSDDFSYLSALEDIYRKENMTCLYFSADGETETYLCTGSHAHILKAVDFTYQEGVSVEDRFRPSDKYLDGQAPYFVSEYWGGAHTHWGDRSFRQRNDEQMKADFTDIIALGASFNDYMFFGGTNFGLMNGANFDEHFKGMRFYPELTTYDYDAALTEWGDYTQRYHDIRKLLANVIEEPLPPLPPRPEFQYIGKVELTQSASLFENDQLASISKSITAEPMEYYDQDYGYVRYSKEFSYDAPYKSLALYGVSDRAHVYLNGQLLGIRTRGQNAEEPFAINNGFKKGDVLDVLVENMGRINFGSSLFRGDRKGILDGIYCEERLMTNFKVYSYTMKSISDLHYDNHTDAKLPAFFKGSFSAKKDKEAFVRFDCFKKGLIWINGFLIGRYWEIGPQHALYIPGCILRQENEIVVFETDGLRGAPCVEITDKPDLLGKTHGVTVE